MATPSELARLRTSLTEDQTEHLQRLLGSWSLLADLSFADLLLAAPVSVVHGSEPQLVVLGQIRPNNRSTLITQDLVGQTVPARRWDLAHDALTSGRLVEGTIEIRNVAEDVVVWNVPVRYRDEVIAVLLRVQGPTRSPANLFERTYLDVSERICSMVSESAFPYPDEEVAAEETPRVGDGAIVVDARGRVEYATPNAVNALHRMGVYSPPDGSFFNDLGIQSTVVTTALATGSPVIEEIHKGKDVAVLAHCVPLLDDGLVTGALILLRDVTDLRRLDRLVLSKDAAIREVHHRVKNNLQTISALLRLQARRTEAEDGALALLEAERRIRSIAIVHEILSKEPGDQVPFDEIIRSLIQMAEDSVVVEHPIEFSVHGELGEATADIATPLAVAIAEILQNAVEHGFVGEDSSDRVGHVAVELGHSRKELWAEIRDNGQGLPVGFDMNNTDSLGVSIVRDLICTQLQGELTMENVVDDDQGGTKVSVRIPLFEK